MSSVRELLERVTRHVHMVRAVAESYGELDPQWRRTTGDYFDQNVVKPLEALSLLKSEGEWVKVSERLPEPGQRVLVSLSDWRHDPAYYKFAKVDDDGEWQQEGFFMEPDPTHWRPLPSPPTGGQEK